MANAISGNQCQCTVCKCSFSTERNFEKHREGSYAEGRRCVEPSSVGLVKKRGIWREIGLSGYWGVTN